MGVENLLEVRICPECGERDVLVDAWVRWNDTEQRDEIKQVTKETLCGQCGATGVGFLSVICCPVAYQHIDDIIQCAKLIRSMAYDNHHDLAYAAHELIAALGNTEFFSNAIGPVGRAQMIRSVTEEVFEVDLPPTRPTCNECGRLMEPSED